MKTILSLAAAAVLLVVAPSTCLAVWDVMQVTKEEAKKLGLEVRSKDGAKNQVSVELEIPLAGDLGRVSEVILQVGQGDNRPVTAALKEDRSKPGRVVVAFWANRTTAEMISLHVMVPGEPGTVGGAMYDLRVKDFVDLTKDR
jgi:hypothetical protein